MPLGAEVLTLISEVKMKQPARSEWWGLEPAISSKCWDKAWPPDVLVLKMTFAVQFVAIFSVSQLSSLAGIGFVQPV